MDFECNAAFQQLEEYLTSPPLLSKPIPGKELLLYLSIGPTAISAVLMQEEDRIQRPIYYISHVLHDVETRYTKIKKLTHTQVSVA